MKRRFPAQAENFTRRENVIFRQKPLKHDQDKDCNEPPSDELIDTAGIFLPRLTSSGMKSSSDAPRALSVSERAGHALSAAWHQCASIGKALSSGCIRRLNDDVIELYRRAPIGTRVIVLAEGV